jgi:hypothetical protein
MRLPLQKKIVVDDNTPAELQATVETIGGILNPFMADTIGILNGGISFDNLESKLIRIDVKTDATGTIIGKPDVLTGLNRPPLGVQCIDVKVTDNVSIIPDITGTPFIIQTPNNATSIKIHKILNLGNNGKYTLTLVFI